MANEFDNLGENEYIYASFQLQPAAKTVLDFVRVTIVSITKNENGTSIGKFIIDGKEKSAVINWYGWNAQDGKPAGLFKDRAQAVKLFNNYLSTKAVWYIRSMID